MGFLISLEIFHVLAGYLERYYSLSSGMRLSLFKILCYFQTIVPLFIQIPTIYQIIPILEINVLS